MKKIICALFSIGLTSTVFAYTEPTTDIVYCPNKIDCTSGTCHPDYDKQQYVGWIQGNGGRFIYTFKKAYSHYNYPHTRTVAEALCQYNGGLIIHYKSEANLEVYQNNLSHWDIHDVSGGYSYTTCTSSDSSQCPLISKPELVIYRKIGTEINSIFFLSVKTFANGIPIKSTIDNVIGYYPWYLTINYDEAFMACQGMKQCKIDISYSKVDKLGNVSQNYFKAGNVVVDMTKNMHIIEVNTGLANGMNGNYLLQQQTPFNSVTFV